MNKHQFLLLGVIFGGLLGASIALAAKVDAGFLGGVFVSLFGVMIVNGID